MENRIFENNYCTYFTTKQLKNKKIEFLKTTAYFTTKQLNNYI